ncbi:MAG TPA: DUF1579 family protein [Planctomycetota bacterium]|nr:DUF1579 family protein [Planctomycetota bacterium]
MRIREFVVTAVAACAIGWVGHSAWSDDPPANRSAAAFDALAEPGEEHARMKALVGEWTTHGVLNMGAAPTTMDGTASITMILGNRYLRQEFRGTFMGSPYEGHGLIGYDNASKEFVSVFIDNQRTGFLLGKGIETTPGKVWTFESSFNGPGGTAMKSKEVLTKVSDKELSYEVFMGGEKPIWSHKYTKK